jgi:HK97 gp10 family phage protein
MSNKAKVEFYGSADLIKKLEKAGANLEKEIANALSRSIQKPKEDMINFMQTKPEHKTGRTVNSWTETIEEKDGVIYMTAGFSVRKGGIASIFWNLGTPYRTPTFFVDKAVEENIDEIKKIQLETLNKAFKGLM